MRLGFTLGDVEVIIFDSTPYIDCSDLSDEEICNLVNPPLAGDEPWESVSQAAFEEACERGMVDYSGYS